MLKNIGITVALTIIIVNMFVGCASTTPAKVYLPSQSSETMAMYKNGVPISVTKTDSALFMTSLEPSDVAGYHYMRLWFLYKNNSSAPYLLEPKKVATLTFNVTKDNKNFPNVPPESPTEILAHIKNQEAMNLIGQAIGGTLQAISAQPTTITDPHGNSWTMNDVREKRNAIGNETTSSMVSTTLWYNIFKESVNSGILRKNTLLPGESVNGFIYFPLPKSISYSNDVRHVNPEECTYLLSVASQGGSKIIEFLPVNGE